MRDLFAVAGDESTARTAEDILKAYRADVDSTPAPPSQPGTPREAARQYERNNNPMAAEDALDNRVSFEKVCNLMQYTINAMAAVADQGHRLHFRGAR